MSQIVLSLALAGVLSMARGLPATPQAAKDVDETFAALDANADGKLSQDEFYRIYELEGKVASPEAKADEFKAWDANGDGWISKTEFTAKYGR